MKVDQPISLAQPVKSDASPCSQRIPTDLVILDLEPRDANTVSGLQKPQMCIA
jgi:hypothetical protein